MITTREEAFEFVEENDVKFIRLAFCDIFGCQKNIAIVASELDRAFTDGISIDASAVKGFALEEKSDLFLVPDIKTLSLLPWRPSRGRVARFFCNIKYPNGKDFELDGRKMLMDAVKELEKNNLTCNIGSECEFYLFKKDEYDNPTNIPYDHATYLDLAPDDKGEDVRREICLTMQNMGIIPTASHHEQGPGQNEVDFKCSDPLSAADNFITVKNIIKTTASHYGLCASFEPKPLPAEPGSGYHINVSVCDNSGKDSFNEFLAGVLKRIKEISIFLNSTPASFERLGEFKAPKYITWSKENRSQLIRVDETSNCKKFELRSADGLLNPYVAYALLIHAGIEGIKNKTTLAPAVDINLFKAAASETNKIDKLPSSYNEALELASSSKFVAKYIPKRLLEAYKQANDDSR